MKLKAGDLRRPISFTQTLTVHFSSLPWRGRVGRNGRRPSTLRRLGKPAGWVPPTAEEAEAAFQAAIDLLRAPTKSGFSEVYPVGQRWQAKPYVKPGSQRSAGYFSSARAAAIQVFMIKMGYEPWPPSPKKGMNKHPWAVTGSWDHAGMMVMARVADLGVVTTDP